MMKSNLKKIFALIQIIASLVLIGATRIWAPVCDGKLELTTGKQVPMKCFWTDRTSMVLAGLIILVAILILISKTDVKKLYFINLVLGVVLFFTYTHIIGVCMKPDMACRTTEIWGKAVAVIVAIAGLLGIFSGKEDQIPSL